nr:hypothetical protein [Tanacetum cinerariifolium]
MLDRTDFASWQQRIRLYCRGKENGVNILNSIDEGPYQMGTVRETLDESTEGAPQFAEDLIENLTNTLALLIQSYRTFLPETNNQLRTSSNARNQATVQDGRVMVQNVQGRPNRARPGQSRPVKCYNCNGTGHIVWNCTQPKRPQNSEYYKDKMLLKQAQENGVALDDLTLNVDNVFHADDCDAFDYDVDEAPTVPDHELYQDAACAHHEGHVTYASVQLDHVVDSHADYTIDSNMIPYDQYVKDNKVSVVHSDASSVTPPKSQQRSGIPLGVLLHSSNT